MIKNGRANFGDRLSEVVICRFLKRYNLSLADGVKELSRLPAIGSILHFVQSGNHIWSSGWNSVINEIMRAKLVFSSPLHGLIIAEAFGIPTGYVRLSETESLFKYKDYYLGTGHAESDFNFGKSIDEGIEMGGMKAYISVRRV